MQPPGPTTTFSTHPFVNVVVGNGGVGSWPGKHVLNTAGQAQISVV